MMKVGTICKFSEDFKRRYLWWSVKYNVNLDCDLVFNSLVTRFVNNPKDYYLFDYVNTLGQDCNVKLAIGSFKVAKTLEDFI